MLAVGECVQQSVLYKKDTDNSPETLNPHSNLPLL